AGRPAVPLAASAAPAPAASFGRSWGDLRGWREPPGKRSSGLFFANPVVVGSETCCGPTDRLASAGVPPAGFLPPNVAVQLHPRAVRLADQVGPIHVQGGGTTAGARREETGQVVPGRRSLPPPPPRQQLPLAQRWRLVVRV